MAKSAFDCPAQDCRGGSPGRQTTMSALAIEEIPEPSRSRIKALNRAITRCNYCGCVYMRDAGYARIFGWLDNGVSDETWIDAGRA